MSGRRTSRAVAGVDLAAGIDRLYALPLEEFIAARNELARDLKKDDEADAAAEVAALKKPTLVACDTMNFWIESRRPDLLALLERVDLITLNDGEARQLTEESNLVKAARWIMKRGCAADRTESIAGSRHAPCLCAITEARS